MNEVKATEIATVPIKRIATVASQGSVARNPNPPRTARSEVRKRLCDSHTPPVIAARPAHVVQPGRCGLDGRFGRESHHRLSANIAAMAANFIPLLAPAWGLKPLLDISDEQARDDLSRVSSAVLSFVAQSARGEQAAVPRSRIAEGATIPEQFMRQRRR